jgi:hypothetical protein
MVDQMWRLYILSSLPSSGTSAWLPVHSTSPSDGRSASVTASSLPTSRFVFVTGLSVTRNSLKLLADVNKTRILKAWTLTITKQFVSAIFNFLVAVMVKMSAFQNTAIKILLWEPQNFNFCTNVLNTIHLFETYRVFREKLLVHPVEIYRVFREKLCTHRLEIYGMFREKLHVHPVQIYRVFREKLCTYPLEIYRMFREKLHVHPLEIYREFREKLHVHSLQIYRVLREKLCSCW